MVSTVSVENSGIHLGVTIGADIVKQKLPTGNGGYLVDAYGGTHSMSIAGSAPMPRATGAGYWPGWNIIRGITLIPGTGGGYLVDAFGGTHPFAATGSKPAGPTAGPYSPPLDLARGIST